MANPVWVTPAGNLGDITSQATMSPVNLRANPVYPASTVFYKLYEGNLPTGLSLSIIGVITGTPLYVTKDTVFGFTVQVYDNLGNTSLRDFYFTVKTSNPLWKTPSLYILNDQTITNTSVYNNIVWSLGTFPLNQKIIDITLTATPVSPATKVTYKLISGLLPTGITLTNDYDNNVGILSGTPTDNVQSEDFKFVIRATDNLGHINDRTFSMTVIGSLVPYFITGSGSFPLTTDSVWYTKQIEWYNPDPINYPAFISIASGKLPPGLEINELGYIRGYPEPPVVEETLEEVETVVTACSTDEQTFTCITTNGFVVGRPIRFTGSVFGGVSEFDITTPTTQDATTYYIKEIVSNSQFKISQTNGGLTFIPFVTTSGVMNATLPTITQNQPITRIYNFTLRINSPLGNQLRNYSLPVTNQNLIYGSGNVRTPVIYNTRPFTYNIDQDITNYGFYVLPELSEITGYTYPENTYAPIGTFYSDNFFTFKILAKDFDNDTLEYFYDIPAGAGLTADPNTGWIRGELNISNNTISTYNFTASVRKKNNPVIISQPVLFNFTVTNNINDQITWITKTNLGNIYNGTTSIFKVEATTNVTLNYELVSGELPKNLILKSNGDIVGQAAFETTDDYAEKDSVIPYTFTVKAYDPNYKKIISSNKTFTINVVQKFIEPTDSLYITCTPSFKDRELIASLLNNDTLIPNSYLYRPDDSNFGKATNVTYVHAYGIHASNLQQYVNAVQINHYNRNIILGPLKTAIARDENNIPVYEVVYSEIVDDLVNPEGVSVNKQIVWDFYVDLNLGPWYTSITDIYTSYIYPVELDILTQDRLFYISTQDGLFLSTNQGSPTFFTSLTPGYAIEFYPNSLENMRKQVEDVLQSDPSSALLPLWMSSQQANGSTLGFTPAWVIAYCKYEIVTDANGNTVHNDDGTPRTYAQQIKYNIENEWKSPDQALNYLNNINFQIDRFSVNKSLTYDFDNSFTPAAWTNLPSGQPVPDPIDSKNFNVLFPRKTILPIRPQAAR